MRTLSRTYCCGIANDGFIFLVRRRGRDVHCIIGVLGRLTTRHGLVISCKEAGRLVSVVSRNPERSFGRLLCETNHASVTNQCLTAPAMCTVPDPSPRSSALHHLSSLRPAAVTRWHKILAHTISSTEFSIISDVARRETVNSDTVLRIVSIKILELVNYWKDTGHKNAVTPFDSRSRVI